MCKQLRAEAGKGSPHAGVARRRAAPTLLPAAALVVALSNANAPAHGQASETHSVPLLAAADDAQHQGFVRVVNRSDAAGELTVDAIDDSGTVRGAITLSLDARQTIHFNSDDLERGNAAKGIAEGVGAGEGNWRLRLASELDIAVHAYMRTSDGFLTSMHDTVPAGPGGHLVPTFNPASNIRQASRLRLVNIGEEAADITIRGVDDQGESPGGEVALSLAAGAARELTAAELESGGDGLQGRLGDGHGKWRLTVQADQPLVLMSLLASTQTGGLTNLSSRPGPRSRRAARVVPLFLAADSPSGQGFARIVNRSETDGVVTLRAVDDAGTSRDPITFAIGAGETIHFNSRDLERGNADKGLVGGVGDGAGDWRLDLRTDVDIEALAYVRTADGFLTGMHDVVQRRNGEYAVATFNPGSNTRQASLLRIVNLGAAPAEATIRGVDDDGLSPGTEFAVSLAAGAARTITAQALESGAGGRGALGDGRGKWRLVVAADQPLLVMSLLASRATGHLTNLSSQSPRAVEIPDANLRAAVADALGARAADPLTTAQLRLLLDLRVADAGVATLDGLEWATNLATLVLTDNAISELGPLADMRWLEELELFQNNVADLEPLAALTRLRTLGLARNNVVNVSALADLADLERLNLGANPLADATPLAGLGKLVELHLWLTRLSSLSPLSSLANLRILVVFAARLTDVSGIETLTRLEQLDADYNAISDLSGFAGLSDLRTLSLNHNQIEDISPLAGLTQLTELYLTDNSISDISPLSALVRLETLHLDFNDITAIDALANAAALRELRLEGNRVADLAPLATLDQLVNLNLRLNNIADLAPLTRIPNLGEGVRIDVSENPLHQESVDVHIPALVAAGVEVVQSEPFPDDDEFPGSRLTQAFNDNMLVMHIGEDVQVDTVDGNPFTGEDILETYVYARHFYRWFEDDFDYLLLLSNLDDIEDHAFTIYSGVYEPTMNDVRGIGSGIYFNNRYGSAGRLRGVIHFPWNAALAEGPALHELQHSWSNFALRSARPGHWGFSSANGQLGGFDLASLAELGAGRYSAAFFSPGGRGRNDAPYSPIELYQAGFLPAEDVPDIWNAADGRWATEDGQPVYDDQGNRVFASDDATLLTIADFIDAAGPRLPNAADAPRSFRGAVILLVDEDHPVSFAQASRLSDHVEWLMRSGEDADATFNYHDYHEATGGRATLRLDGLSESRKSAPSTASLPPSFGVAPPPQFCSVGADGTLTHPPHPRAKAVRAALAERHMRAWHANTRL